MLKINNRLLPIEQDLSSNRKDKIPSIKAVNDALLDVYSTEEKKIGVWVDGKTIYKKTFIGAFADKQSLISNVETLIDGYGTGDNGTGITRVIPYYEYYNDNAYSLTINKQGNEIFVASVLGGKSAKTTSSTHITLEYTKTTD
jgi:hypothetical protein